MNEELRNTNCEPQPAPAMPLPNGPQPVNYYCPEVIKTYSFTNRDKIFAALAAVLGFLFIKMLIAPLSAGSMGIGAAVSMMALSIYSTLYNAQRKPLDLNRCIRIALCAAFSANIFLCSNMMIQFLDAVFVFLVMAYDNLSDDGRFRSLRPTFISDMASACVVLPMSEAGALPAAAKDSAKSSSFGRKLGGAVLGLILAAIPTIIVAFALASADDGFSDIMDGFFENGFSNIIILVLQLIISIPVSCYIYGMHRASDNKAANTYIRDDRHNNTLQAIRIISPTTGLFFVLPVCVLYVVFFFSQISYYISAFMNKLPAGSYSYSAYARQGFFELCTVAVINLIMVSALSLFCKRRDNGRKAGCIRIITCVMCVFTLLLIATAVSKMDMYICCYGLTPLRVYTTWFMVLLALLFIGIMLAEISTKVNLPKLAVTGFIIMFSTLSFSNADRLIAAYNVDRCLDGTLESFDMSLVYELSPSAIPEILRVKDTMSAEESERLMERIISRLSDDGTYVSSDIVFYDDLRNVDLGDMTAAKAVMNEK